MYKLSQYVQTYASLWFNILVKRQCFGGSGVQGCIYYRRPIMDNSCLMRNYRVNLNSNANNIFGNMYKLETVKFQIGNCSENDILDYLNVPQECCTASQF